MRFMLPIFSKYLIFVDKKKQIIHQTKEKGIFRNLTHEIFPSKIFQISRHHHLVAAYSAGRIKILSRRMPPVDLHGFCWYRCNIHDTQ